MGEALRKLPGKCKCALAKNKAAEFFNSMQLGVACHSRDKLVAHALKGYIEEHWMMENFVVLKLDMRSTFKIVSRQAVVDVCATFSPELLSWVSCCYGKASSALAPTWQDQL